MNVLCILAQSGLDAGALAVCCEGVFQKRSEARGRDILLFPVLLVLCVVPRVNFVANEGVRAALSAYGYEIVPVNSIAGWLFLVFSVLLLHSIYFKWENNGDVLSGTMAVFSLYLLVRCVCVAVLAAFGAWGGWLLFGGHVLTLLLVSLLFCTPFYGGLQQLVLTGGIAVWIVSSDIAVLLMVALTVVSFQAERFLSHSGLLTVLVLAVLLFNSILLFFHRRRLQEQKRIHMIEQYVPIVEELISQVRARQHEFQNRMLAIEAAVASAGTLEEAQREVAALTGGIVINSNDRELLSCDSKVIAGMLFGKIKQAEAAGIHMELQLQGLFKKSAVPETEWIEAIGILLDNAIEASPKGSTVYIAVGKKGTYLELLVSNPAPAMSNTEFMGLFRKGFTTKSSSEGRGYGLYNILRITERYHRKIVTRNEAVSEENHVVFGVLLP